MRLTDSTANCVKLGEVGILIIPGGDDSHMINYMNLVYAINNCSKVKIATMKYCGKLQVWPRLLIVN